MAVTKRITPSKNAPTPVAPPSKPAPLRIDMDDVRRKAAERRAAKEQAAEDAPRDESVKVSAGPVDKIVDMVFNPSQEKMLEFTVLDRNQTRLIPQLGIIDEMWEYCIEVATCRYDHAAYMKAYRPTGDAPVPKNLMQKFVFMLAQCQKSLNGQNLKSAIDLALADVETRSNQEGGGNLDGSGFKDD